MYYFRQTAVASLHLRVGSVIFFSMSDGQTEIAEDKRFSFRRLAFRAIVVLVVLIAAALVYIYSQREALVRDFVANELESKGIEATYEIEDIGIGRQILRDIVIGNPDSPDAIVDKLELRLKPVWGGVEIESVRLDGLRLFGTYRDGKFSLGALDPYLESDSDAPFEWPDFFLTLVDARARLDTDYGIIGISADGSGNLGYGFDGNIAAISRELRWQGCTLENPTLFGEIEIPNGAPKFSGPIRLEGLSCKDRGIAIGKSAIEAEIAMTRDMKEISLATNAALNGLGFGDYRADSVAALTEAKWNSAGLNGNMDISADGADFAGAVNAQLSIKGDFSAAQDFTKAEFDGDIRAGQVRVSDAQWQSLSATAKQASETPVGALLAKLVATGRSQSRDMSVRAPLSVQYDAQSTRIFVQTITGSNGNGGRLFSAQNIRASLDQDGLRNAGGSFDISGAGLPQLSADFEALSVNSFRVTARMPLYQAGSSSLALPLLVVQKNGSGAYGFSGRALLSGPLPGGYVRALQVPIEGGWSRTTGLRMYKGCQSFRFAALQYANVRSDANAIRLCPNASSHMLTQRGGQYIVSASLPDGQFNGYLGDTPIDVQADSLAFSLPGKVNARGLRIAIGDETVTTIRADTLAGIFGNEFTGSFTGAEAGISNVPLDLTEGSGKLRFAGGVLELQADNWIVSDREELDRFEPMVTHNAQLRLEDGIITADALLHEPRTDAVIAGLDIRHDLNRAVGSADINVSGVRFNDELQPEMLTGLALGVVANVQGEVRGTGRIDWNADGVTSTGKFRTDDMDLAAAFGPVTGLSGEIEFTDLLGLETAPGQTVTLGEVNPGIAALDGLVSYQLLPGQRVKVEGGEWPFSGGTLYLEPTILDLSQEKARYLAFRIEGLDAAKFLLKFDFDNLTATGTFDGRLPMVFDQNGGRIDGGRLDVRSDGGTLAYVGQLTYEDLSPMANYAFEALKSLRYRELTIKMNGPLEGEIVTEVNMSGITQGEGAKQDFIQSYIKRELRKIPLEFNVTITAPFMQLVTTGRSLYDSEYVLDPFAAGLIDPSDIPEQPDPADSPPAIPETRRENESSGEPAVQPLESENMP